MQRPEDDMAAYWLQLVLSIVIATLGMAIDSAPTVIGAMLVSPLMTPIVEVSLSLLIGASWPIVRR
jgi:uncharacterized membrane protein